MKHSDSLTSVQMAIIVISTMLGVSMLALSRFVIEKVGKAAPLASVAGIGLSMIGFLGLIYLGRRFPQSTFIGYNRIILGKIAGNFFIAIYLILTIALIGLETRQFAEVLIGSLLPNTPIYFSIFFMLFLCAVINYSNVSTFAYIHFFYLPLIILPLLLVLLPSLQDIEYYHVLPINGHNLSAKEFLSGAIVMMAGISNYFIISMIIPYMKNPKNCAKGGIWGFFIGAFIVFFLITITLAVFGEVKMLEMMWPTIVLARMVSVPGEVMARIDAIFLISWIFAVFTTLLSYYFLFVRGIAEMMHSKKYRFISSITLFFAFVIAIIPEDIYDVYNYLTSIWTGGVIFYTVYVIFLVGFAKILRKKGRV